MIDTTPGALVRYREREWVVPSGDPNMVLLRIIGGSVFGQVNDLLAGIGIVPD